MTSTAFLYDYLSLLSPSHSSSVIPVHASMLCLSCPSLRAMAVAPSASGLAPWKFVLSNHVTDAAVRTYFSLLYTPCIEIMSLQAYLFTHCSHLSSLLGSYKEVVQVTLCSSTPSAAAGTETVAAIALPDHAGTSTHACKSELRSHS